MISDYDLSEIATLFSVYLEKKIKEVGFEIGSLNTYITQKTGREKLTIVTSIRFKPLDNIKILEKLKKEIGEDLNREKD